jgi:hypothetical protein
LDAAEGIDIGKRLMGKKQKERYFGKNPRCARISSRSSSLSEGKKKVSGTFSGSERKAT